MSRPEATLQKHIIDRCEARGAYVVKVHQTGRGRRGIPDVLMCFLGYFIAMEVKSTSSLTEAQKAELEKVRMAGGVRAVVRSVETAMGVLDQIERHHRTHDSDITWRTMGQRVLVGHIPTARRRELDLA